MRIMLIVSLFLMTACSPPTNQEGITLEIDASYTSGTLYLVPMIVHEGNEAVSVSLYDAELRIVEVTREDATVYESSPGRTGEEPVILEQGEVYEGSPVRFTAEAGEYDVRAVAEITVTDDELAEELSLSKEVTVQVQN